MRYLLTFRRTGRTEPVPESLENLFFDAIETCTGMERLTAEQTLYHLGKIETPDFVFLSEYADTQTIIPAASD